MTHVENIHTGDYLVVCGLKDESEPYVGGKLSGEPMRVLHVDVPFVVVKSRSGQVGALDVRDLAVKKVGKRYWDAFAGSTERKRKPKKSKKPVIDDGWERCVRCGTRMVQSQQLRDRQWYYKCPECGSLGDPVPATA